MKWAQFIMAMAVAALLSSAPPGAASTPNVSMDLKITDPADWQFTNGAWAQSKAGQITPPNVNGQFFQAFYLTAAFADLTAEFDVQPGYRDNGLGSAGLIFRAQDASRYYLAYIPWGGQQTRAKHFWAAIAKVDRTGYIHNLKMELVHDVVAEPTASSTRWYRVKVTCTGPEIKLWVDGRPGPAVRDETFTAGRVGLFGQGAFEFKNVHIKGMPVSAEKWDDTLKRAPPWTVPAPKLAGGQLPAPMVKLPSGAILLSVYDWNEGRVYVLRSGDKGQTWGQPQALPYPGQCILHCRKDGRLILLRRVEGAPQERSYDIAESADEGKTWSKLKPCVAPGGWVKGTPPGFAPGFLFTPGGSVFDTPSGALVRFMAGRHESDSGNVLDWGRTHVVGYSIRSKDGGHTWSAMTPLDGPPSSGQHMDQTEPCSVVTQDGKLMVLIRPIYSPWMWKTWSENDGVSWRPLTRSGIPGYAQMLGRTTSGAILVAHRFPHTTIHVSRDNGLSWDAGTVVDPGGWANPQLVEAEPEVMLLLYPEPQGYRSGGACRLQRIRVTPDRIVPIPPKASRD